MLHHTVSRLLFVHFNFAIPLLVAFYVSTPFTLSRHTHYFIQIFRIIFVRYVSGMYPVKLEIKETTESSTSASLDLLLSIGREVSCALPFLTNGTISTSISQTFLSCVAIYHLHQPTVCLFLELAMSLLDFSPRIPLGTFSILLISQLIRYDRACSSYECFILRVTRLSCKLFGMDMSGNV